MAEVLLENASRKAREYFEKGFAAMERNNLDYAMDMFSATLEIEPSLLKARKFLRAASVKKFKEAKGGALTHMISTLTGLSTLLMGMSALKKKPVEALQAGEKLLRLDPLNLTFINFFVQAAEACTLPEVAAQALEVAKEHYPKDIVILERLAKLYSDTNMTHEARSCYEELMRLRPNDPKALKKLKDAVAMDTMNKGGWTGAKDYRSVMKDSKEAVRLEQESKAVKSSSDLDELIAEHKVKIQREPENINYRRALADYYARADRMDEALATLEDAQKSMGRTDPQIERLISTYKVKQFDLLIQQSQGKGDTATAESILQKKNSFMLQDAQERVKKYPNDLQFRYELGVLLFENNLLTEAIEEFQLSQRNPQRRTRSLYFMALCFKNKQQYDISMEQMSKAASELTVMDDTKKDILYEMGILYELMGQPDKAVEHYKEIYSVDIRYKDISKKIEQSYKK